MVKNLHALFRPDPRPWQRPHPVGAGESHPPHSRPGARPVPGSLWEEVQGLRPTWKVMPFQYLHSKVSLFVGTESSLLPIYFCQGLLLGGGEALEDTSLAMMIPSKSHSLPQYQGLPQLLADSHVCWSTQLPSRVLYPRETEQGQGIFSTARN